MKLRPTQIVGVIAIVLFGGGMIYRLTQPSEREIMAERIASLPSMTTPEITMPPLELTNPTPVAPLDLSAPAGATSTSGKSIYDYPGAPDHLNVGSQAAKDDLYCAGVISAEFDARPDQPPEEMSKQIAAMRALDEAGLAKLRAEGAATESNGAGFSLAYTDKAEKDRAANVLRIPFTACMTRATTVPPAPN